MVVAIIVLAALAGLLVWAFQTSRKEGALEQERELPIKAPSRVSTAEGEIVVSLDGKTLEKSGIVVLPLAAASHRREIRAAGTALQLQGLFDSSGSYATAKSLMEKGEAALEASRREYERLKPLNADNRNISDKVLQSAEAVWRADAAAMESAKVSLSALAGSLRQQWGGVISRWLIDDSPAFERLIRQEDVLLQITFPPDVGADAGAPTIRVQSGEGTPLVTVGLVSPSPRTDPRIQGKSFFYLAPAHPHLVPGMNVLAFVPVGPSRTGVIVPSRAAVWWQGKAWVYLEKGSGRFVRREIPTETPIREGWFVAGGFSPGDKVVVKGAQLLQSEEFRSQIQVGEEGGDK